MSSILIGSTKSNHFRTKDLAEAPSRSFSADSRQVSNCASNRHQRRFVSSDSDSEARTRSILASEVTHGPEEPDLASRDRPKLGHRDADDREVGARGPLPRREGVPLRPAHP